MKKSLCLLALIFLLAGCGDSQPEAVQPSPTSPAIVESTPIPEPTKTVAESAQIPETPKPAVTQNNCDPSYPTVCLAPAPPDLDCKDVSEKNFTVNQPDPHKLDGDKDGIGCESK